MLLKHIKQGLVSIATMFCAAIIIIFTAALLQRPATPQSTVQPYRVTGNTLRTVVGHALADGSSIKLSALQNGIAVMSTGQARISASMFPYVSLQITSLTTHLLVELFWRNRGQLNAVHTEQLSHFDGDSLTVHLANNPDWRDEIVEFGLSIQGNLSSPLVIDSIRFEPWSVSSWLSAVWDQWWAYGGWKGTSVNFISGGRYDKIKKIKPPELPMVTLTAIWLGLSIALYFLVTRLLTIHVDWVWPFTMLLLAWMLLDSRWLHEFWLRTQFTQSQYSGKNQVQKWQTGNDGQWFLLAQQVKQQIPEQSARIFEVMKTRRPLDDYYRYRLRYHLLPHNVFPFLQTLPETRQVKDGDYILDLGEISHLRYNKKSLELIDPHLKSALLRPVILKYQSRLGRLYQYKSH